MLESNRKQAARYSNVSCSHIGRNKDRDNVVGLLKKVGILVGKYCTEIAQKLFIAIKCR